MKSSGVRHLQICSAAAFGGTADKQAVQVREEEEWTEARALTSHEQACPPGSGGCSHLS